MSRRGRRRIKNKIKKVLSLIFIILCIVGLTYSLYNIINWKRDVDNNKKIVEEIKDDININEEDDTYEIDFKSLKEYNSDTIAYIKVNNTNINYIVVKGNDNSYYLKHNFEKKWNIAGWIFGDYHNRFDGTDKNLIIYGHNTKDGSMFGTLKNVLDKDWYENKENHIVTLVTENGQYDYQVFSTYSIKPEDYYISTDFKNNTEFDKFVKNLQDRTIYDYGVEVSGKDNILTLSSCLGDGSKRAVLHAKLIKRNSN